MTMAAMMSALALWILVVTHASACTLHIYPNTKCTRDPYRYFVISTFTSLYENLAKTIVIIINIWSIFASNLLSWTCSRLYPHSKSRVKSVEECCDKCTNDTQCGGFTFHPAGETNLLSTIHCFVAFSGSTSGNPLKTAQHNLGHNLHRTHSITLCITLGTASRWP